MKFVLKDPAKRTLVVKAPSFFDARHSAQKLFARRFHDVADPIDVVLAEDAPEAHFELSWVGSDASGRPNKHLEVRERDRRGVWSPWESLT